MLTWLLSSWYQPSSQPPSSPSEEILCDTTQHPILSSLRELVESGGGEWPPRATYRDTWPIELRVYDSVWREMEPLFPARESSTDNAHNRQLINAFRNHMQALLDERINMRNVQSALDRAASDPQSCSQGAWLGIWLCISMLRHAYRWGVSPIVSEAQNEETLDLPEQLNVPWRCLQKHFGTTSPGGCMTSLMYANLRADDRLEYSVNIGMPETHQSTEYWNTKLICSMEERTLTMYHLFARTIAFLDSGDLTSATATLKSANEVLKTAFKHFFATLVDSNLVQSVWLAYVQGYQGWTLEGIDGISGGQSLLFRTLDAFLGIRPFPTSEKESLHLPTQQRAWLNFLRDYDIRAKVKENTSDEAQEALTTELEGLVKQLRLWRMGHMRRMQPYESVRRPERKTMTAGISVVDAENENLMIEHLKKELGRRLAETI
ncbi:hypothetical protein MIND_00313000 [Mycena indigotica]|uniref:Indoleamine 2,3-dioxygenase n=1 Tax=Mycena indigotica TaxID=2126181 RepID=A0A8H6W974_9AGAR|nr:uncharacterized protein MIND_00313000 [Mycena indigotica]KAF7309422.1 hypothetical protein MIND_00313000 [Mycena indigotica]